MTNAYHAILSAFQSASTSAPASPATMVTALSDLLSFTLHQVLPWVVGLVSTLGSLLTDPDQLLLWLDYDKVHQYVRTHLATLASVLMALILVWMAWQALWAVQRIVRVIVSVVIKLVVAGMVLAVVWNVYTAATTSSGATADTRGPTASGRYTHARAAGEYAYGRAAAPGSGGWLDQVFSAAKEQWVQQKRRGYQQQWQQDETGTGEYSYAWPGRKYRNRREAELDNGL